ncbi:TGFB1 factor, partial [Pomatostomus ruficeps]|nr:TGFB1 factor [Pomatostomus ruficeps]
SPLLLVAVLGSARGLSSCRSLDLEAARLKRIEAVRGQILSKLRLPAPPAAEEEPGPPRPLPEDVRALYNSTRELLRQRARLRPAPDPQEYYGKELLRFPMETPGEGEGTRGHCGDTGRDRGTQGHGDSAALAGPGPAG